jgi:hypothetical protein
MFRNSALQIGVQHMKNLRVKRFAHLPTLGASLLVAGLLAFSAQATQTVDPFTAATGGSNMNGTTVPFTGNAVAFFGIYSTTTAAAESGLGVKVKYDSSKVSVVVSEEYDGCRIAAAQVQTPTVPGVGAQAVMGWIDTSIRTSGAVGWPNVAEPAASGGLAPCLDPGSINGTPTGTTSGQKLFKVVATRVAGFTTGTTPINIDSDGNFSYAGGTAGFAPKSFTIDAAASGGGLTLAASNPIVSRKTHGAAGVFDIPVDATQAIGSASITVEPRAIGTGHQIVFTFTSAPAAAGTATVTNAGGTSVGSATTSISGNSVIVSLTAVTDRQRVNVNVSNVGGAGVFGSTVPVAFLEGDVDSSKQVSGTDVNQVKASVASGGVVNASSFRRDIDFSGSITGTDVNRVKSKAASSPGPL